MVAYIIAGLLLIAAVGFYIPAQLWSFGKLKWSKSDTSFWGTLSHRRKFRKDEYGVYHNGERAFWQSDGLLVFVTDGYHLFQFLAFRCIYGSVALLTPWPWWVFVSLFTGHALFFWLFQKLFTRS